LNDFLRKNLTITQSTMSIGIFLPEYPKVQCFVIGNKLIAKLIVGQCSLTQGFHLHCRVWLYQWFAHEFTNPS
jgi:hypothetical protein